ncbi:MAG: secretin N-terminal domain-containing protein, partial [Candidatus Omnitrophota bacterium]
ADNPGSPASQTLTFSEDETFNSTGDIETGLAVPVSLDLREMDIVDTIKFLATKGNLNIVATKSVSGRVTLFLNSVTIADVLDIIILTNSLARETKKNIITLMTDAEYKALYGKPYVDKRDAKTIVLKYADPSGVVTMLGNIKSDVGKVVADTTTATVILIDIPEKIEEMEEIIKQVDLPTISRVIPTVEETFVLSYAEAKTIAAEITKSLTENIGVIRTDERTNTLVIADLAHNMEKIRKLVKAFDAKTKQVLVEAKVVELTLDDDDYKGIEWEKIFRTGDNLDLPEHFLLVLPAVHLPWL